MTEHVEPQLEGLVQEHKRMVVGAICGRFALALVSLGLVIIGIDESGLKMAGLITLSFSGCVVYFISEWSISNYRDAVVIWVIWIAVITASFFWG